MTSHTAVVIECFFDYSSPWTYLAFSQIQGIAKRHPSCTVEYKPFLVGGVFNKVNPSVYEARKAVPVKAKVVYANKDLQEWAEAYGLTIHGPYEADPTKRVKPFPVNSVKSLRGALFAQRHGVFLKYSALVFHAYWGLCKDISNDDVLQDIASKSGLNVHEFMTYIATAEAKKVISDNTDELIERGGYGSPTFFVNSSHMYFGNDRLLLLERRIMLETGAKDAQVGSGMFVKGLEPPLSNL